MKNLRYFDRYRKRLYDGSYGDNKVGFFWIPKAKGYYQVYATTGGGWDHVSFCLLTENGKFEKRIPKWNDVCKIKEMFFDSIEDVVEIHPKAEDYVNEHPYVLHLWKPTVKEMPIPTEDDLKNEVTISEEIIKRKDLNTKVTVRRSLNWEHILVEILTKKGDILERYPTWEEMCIIKETEFNGDEAVIQIHSNVLPYDGHTRHLWKPLTKELPLPPSEFVGIKKKYSK